MEWTQLVRKQLFSTYLTMSECDSAQFWFIIEKKNLQSYISFYPVNGHSQTGSNIFVTGHMTGSGTTTYK